MTTHRTRLPSVQEYFARRLFNSDATLFRTCIFCTSAFASVFVRVKVPAFTMQHCLTLMKVLALETCEQQSQMLQLDI